MDILLIDDDEDTTFLMSILFQKSGVVENYYIKQRADDALDMLGMAKTLPDCIFVDLKMPEMNGFEFIERFEQIMSEKLIKKPWPQVYILSSTARQSEHDRAESYQSVKDFILKPLTKTKLLQISEWVRNKN